MDGDAILDADKEMGEAREPRRVGFDRERRPGEGTTAETLLAPERFSCDSPIERLMIRRAIYPGSFDPVTYGHLDVIGRAAKLFDEVIVAILKNPGKSPLFTVEERIDMLRRAVTWPNVSVDAFEGLLVEYAKRKQATVIIRGIRAVSDYEYELQMALMNRRLYPEAETIFMLPGEDYSYISSKLVKEVFSLGGSVSGLVPRFVEQRMREKFKSHAPHVVGGLNPNE